MDAGGSSSTGYAGYSHSMNYAYRFSASVYVA